MLLCSLSYIQNSQTCWLDDHYKILLRTKQLSFTDPFIEVFYLRRLFSDVNHGDFMVYTCFLLTAHISVQPFQPCFFLITMSSLNVNHHNSPKKLSFIKLLALIQTVFEQKMEDRLSYM